MRFENPLFLFAIAIIPLLYRYVYREGKERRLLLSYSDLRGIRDKIRLRRHYRSTLFALRTLAILLIVIALARPQSEKSFESIEAQGIDIMLALDISGSMRAEDFKPRNRIYVAKQVVSDFIGRASNDRIGLVVFAAKSFTRCPLTLDYDMLRALLEDVDVGMIEDGTAIGLALANCVARLKDSDAKSKIVILLTDGVNNRGEIDPLTGASLAKAAGVKVYTIGVGKEGGAPVPIIMPDGRKVYQRNPDGTLVLTEIDEETLKKIAEITGGEYYRATDEKALDEIYKRILEMEKTAFRTKTYVKRKEIVRYILPFVVALLVSESILIGAVWRKIP